MHYLVQATSLIWHSWRFGLACVVTITYLIKIKHFQHNFFQEQPRTVFDRIGCSPPQMSKTLPFENSSIFSYTYLPLFHFSSGCARDKMLRKKLTFFCTAKQWRHANSRKYCERVEPNQTLFMSPFNASASYRQHLQMNFRFLNFVINFRSIYAWTWMILCANQPNSAY